MSGYLPRSWSETARHVKVKACPLTALCREKGWEWYDTRGDRAHCSIVLFKHGEADKAFNTKKSAQAWIKGLQS